MKKMTVLLLSLVFAAFGYADTYTLPADGSRIVGQLQTATAKRGDTLNRLAVRYGVGYNEMVRANPKFKRRKIPAGTSVIIPKQYRLPDAGDNGIVINLADMRLFYFPGGSNEVMTFPIAIGKRGWRTPQGQTSVVRKHRHPTWTPPASIRREAARRGKKLRRVYPAGPNNPLGTRALRLGISGYLIHGTNRPYSIGKRVSHGCIRLRRPDIEALFDLVDIDTPVTIVSQRSQSPAQADTVTENLAKATPSKTYRRAAKAKAKRHYAKKSKVQRRKSQHQKSQRRREQVDYHTAQSFNYRRVQEAINNGSIKTINFNEM